MSDYGGGEPQYDGGNMETYDAVEPVFEQTYDQP